MLRSLSKVVVPASLLAMVGSCGGKVAEPVRPPDYTAKTAIGGSSPPCTGTPKLATPLVVDLEADARVDLEAALKKSVVVVAYDCNSLRVLSNCKLSDAGYEYVGVSKKETVVQLKGADEVSVNLPLSAGKFGAQVQAGRTLDLGLVYVGRQSTVVGQAKGEELRGTCEGATHYIQKATLGAFAMSTGSVGKVSAVGELFKVGASAQSESARQSMTSDGSLEACRKSAGAETQINECKAPLKLELTPIIGKVAAAPASGEAAPPSEAAPTSGEAAPPSEAANEKEPKKTPDENPCKAGYVLTNEICTKKTETVEGGYLCDRANSDECKAQCEKGSPGSCFNYGLSNLSLGDKTKRTVDPVPYLQKACDAGHAEGCAWFGYEVLTGAANPEVFKKGYDALKTSCDLGSGQGCVSLSEAQKLKGNAPTYDMAASFKSIRRGCALGAPSACAGTAWAYVKGEGVPKDPQKGVEFFAKACQSGDTSVCRRFSEALYEGKDGFPKDVERALKIRTGLCDSAKGIADTASDCEPVASMLVDLKKYDEAFKVASKACRMENGSGCEVLLKMYETGKGTKKDPAKAKAIRQKLCDPNSALIALDAMRETPICGPAKPRTKTKPKK